MNVITIVIIVTIIHTTPLSFATPSSCVSPSPSYISLHFSSPSYLSEVSEEQGLRGCFQQVPALSPEASSPPNDKKIFNENQFSSCKDIYFQYSREKKVTKRKFFLTLKWAASSNHVMKIRQKCDKMGEQRKHLEENSLKCLMSLCSIASYMCYLHH